MEDRRTQGDSVEPIQGASDLPKESVRLTYVSMTDQERAVVRKDFTTRFAVFSIGTAIVLAFATYLLIALVVGESGKVGDGIIVGLIAGVIGLWLAFVAVRWGRREGAELPRMKTVWANGVIGLSERWSSNTRTPTRIYSLRLSVQGDGQDGPSDVRLDIPDDLYATLERNAIKPGEGDHRRAVFNGSVQYVPQSQLVLRVIASPGGAVFTRDGLAEQSEPPSEGKT